MLTAHDIVWGMVYPLLIAAVVIVLAHIRRARRRDTHPWGVPLAIAVGFIVAFIGISGKLNIPPRQGQEWLAVSAAAALVISIIASISERTRLAVIGLSIALLLATAWLIAANRKPLIPAREFWLTVALIGGGMLAWWVAIEPLASRRRGITLPLLLSAVAGGAALVLINGHTQRLGQIQGGVAVVLLVIALMALWLRDLSLSRGGVLAVAAVVLGLLACGYLYADVTWIEAAIVAAAPLIAWAGQLPFVRTRKPWVRFVITAILVLGVVAIAAVPAANGLRRTLQDQSESYMY